MARREQSPREKAARALCEALGGYPDTVRHGRKVWTYYIERSDRVLWAALGGDGWRDLVRDDDPEPSDWP